MRGHSWVQTTSPDGFRRADVIRVGLLAAVATSPLIPLALFFKKMIEKTFEGIAFAGFGFLITAAVLLLTAWLKRRDGAKGPAEMSWLDALLIGLAQMFAPLPGVSRSGLTIAAALALGVVTNLGRRIQLDDCRAGRFWERLCGR